MNLASSDPLEVLEALRQGANARLATDGDFTSPEGDDVRAIEVAGPGVVHPAHVGWVAECLGRPEASVVLALGELGEGNGVSAITNALLKVDTPARLRGLGVRAAELVIRRVPVLPGQQRANVVEPVAGGRSVLSPLNAAYQDLLRHSRTVATLIELDGPEIIVESRALNTERAFERLLALLRGQGHRFSPQAQPNTDPPTPDQLVVAPARSGPPVSSPTRAIEVRLIGTTALIRFPVALARIDLESGSFSVQPFAGAGFATINEAEAVFCDGSRLSVLNLASHEFVAESKRLPTRVILGACCGVEILDTASRTTALLPGPLASSGYDVAISPCGRYGWLEIAPEADEVGVFSVETIARVCHVWPHATLGTPVIDDDPGEGHDGTLRALVRLDDGSFRFVYGNHLLSGDHAHELPDGATAASFDSKGSRLALVDASHLIVCALGPAGEPTRVARWSLDTLHAHLVADHLDFTDTGLDAEAAMGATGTITTLSRLTAAELSERVFFNEDPNPEALERLLAQARATPVGNRLRPA